MRYVVTAGYVTVTTAVPGGRARVDIPRGARLPEDTPAEDIGRCLALGHIEAEAEQVDEAAGKGKGKGRGKGKGKGDQPEQPEQPAEQGDTPPAEQGDQGDTKADAA